MGVDAFVRNEPWRDTYPCCIFSVKTSLISAGRTSIFVDKGKYVNLVATREPIWPTKWLGSLCVGVFWIWTPTASKISPMFTNCPKKKTSIHSIEIFVLIRFDLNKILLEMKVYEVKLDKGYLLTIPQTMNWNLFEMKLRLNTIKLNKNE